MVGLTSSTTGSKATTPN